MARCPYAPHRLVVGDGGACGRCGGDVRLYAVLRWLPDLVFNDARQLLLAGDREAAAALVQRAINLRAGFPEAHWLMAAIEGRRGRVEEAKNSLARAHSMGAKVDPGWFNQEEIESGRISQLPGSVNIEKRPQGTEGSSTHERTGSFSDEGKTV